MQEVGLTEIAEGVVLDSCRCPFCAEETIVPEWKEKIMHHLVVTVDDKNHVHVHGPINNKTAMEEMVKAINREIYKEYKIK